jgi:hypothetical protein
LVQVNHCRICRNKVRKAGIDASLANGLGNAAVARDQTATGWAISPETVKGHREHYEVPLGVAKPRDLAILVRDRTMDAIEDGRLAITDKDLWKNVNPGLKAQSLLDVRASKTDDRQVAIAFATLLAGGIGGFLAPVALRLEDGNVIDGDAVEVPGEGVIVDG